MGYFYDQNQASSAFLDKLVIFVENKLPPSPEKVGISELLSI